MVNATVDNSPVSITLSVGESTTVPTGEVWKVTITGFSDTDKWGGAFKINGERVVGYPGGNPYGTNGIVLTGGDTIKSHSNSKHGVHISGFVVN